MSKEIKGRNATEWCDFGFELGKEGKFEEVIENLKKSLKSFKKLGYESEITKVKDLIKNIKR